MEVRLYATLRPIAGKSKVMLEHGAGSTVRQLLDELVIKYPGLKRELFSNDNELHSRIHVFVDGRDVRYLDGLDMTIPENVDVCIFPPVGGGA